MIKLYAVRLCINSKRAGNVFICTCSKNTILLRNKRKDGQETTCFLLAFSALNMIVPLSQLLILFYEQLPLNRPYIFLLTYPHMRIEDICRYFHRRSRRTGTYDILNIFPCFCPPPPGRIRRIALWPCKSAPICLLILIFCFIPLYLCTHLIMPYYKIKGTKKKQAAPGGVGRRIAPAQPGFQPGPRPAAADAAGRRLLFLCSFSACIRIFYI